MPERLGRPQVGRAVEVTSGLIRSSALLRSVGIRISVQHLDTRVWAGGETSGKSKGQARSLQDGKAQSYLEARTNELGPVSSVPSAKAATQSLCGVRVLRWQRGSRIDREGVTRSALRAAPAPIALIPGCEQQEDMTRSGPRMEWSSKFVSSFFRARGVYYCCYQVLIRSDNRQSDGDQTMCLH